MTETGKDKNEWPSVSQDARILYSLLFYSQGPVDGYLIGEKARDFFLHSGLPLPTLSQIWNLADISNDNLLTVEEFILTMYFCHGALQGKKLPRSLSAALRPPEKSPVSLPFLTQEEKIIFSKIFEAIDDKDIGFIEGSKAKAILTATGVNTEELKIIWDLSDINRDGRLDYGEWTVACQLIKLIKQGQSLDVPINVFTNLPERIAPGSLQAGKKRVAEYEERKQKLMKLKERRRLQSEREKKRLELTQKKVALLTQVYDVLEKENSTQLPELQKKIADDRENIEKQEIIVYRLKKEHEKVRQETVKIILGEQKVSSDIKQIKEQTDELNKTLRSSHSKATKDPDPFHQLYEERKGYKLSDVETEIFSPFNTHIFSESFLKKLSSTSSELFGGNNNNNNKMASVGLPSDKKEEFMKSLDRSNRDGNNMEDLEEDTVFKSISGLKDVETLSGLSISSNDLLLRLQDLKNDFIKLNSDGGPVVFRNPDDYLAKKFVKEEEDRQFRHYRRASDRGSLDSTPDSLRRRSANTTPESYKRRSQVDYGPEATQAAREYRQKRRSLTFDPSKEGYSPSSPGRKYQDIKSHYSPSALKSKSKSEGKLNKSPERSPKKAPAPLPPSHNHSKNSPSNKNSSRTSPKTGKEKIRAAKSEPNLSNLKLEIPKSPITSNENCEPISPKISGDIKVKSDLKSLVEISGKTEPIDKPSSPTRPSVKKSRAPAPPSPSSISPQPLSHISYPQQYLPQNQTKNSSDQLTEAVIESRSAAVFKNGPLSTSSPLLSPSSTVSPPISPSDAPPVAPPRRKKEQRKNSVKSPSSPKSPLNGEFKLETKKEKHNISQDSLEFKYESTSKEDSRSLEDQRLKAERPNTLFTNSNYNNLEQISPLLKEITDTLEMNENKQTSPQRPVRRESSKKKAAPQPPGVKQETSFAEDTNLSWENPPRTNTDSKSITPTVVIEESSKPFETNGIHDQDDNKMNVGLKPRNTFDRMSISSYDSVDSIPPPLPSSAPPALPASAAPLDDDQISPEEVIEVEYTVPHQMSIQESDDEDHNRLNHLAASRYNEIEETSSKIKIRNGFKFDESDESDTSTDDEQNGFSATFSPGDSGIMTSLPTSPDEADGNRGVSLISYKNEKTTLTNQPVESSSSTDSQFEDSSSLGFDSKRSMFEEKKPNFKPLKTMSPTSPTSPSGPLSPSSRKYNSEELMEKSRQFAEMVQKPSFSMKVKNSDEYSQETLQEFELNRRSVISMSTMKKKDVRSPTEPEKCFIQEAEQEPVVKTETNKVRHWEVNTEPPKNRTPDKGWDGQKNVIYSQNIVQENGTTDLVDRESISDSLHNTKRQWEGAFKDHIDNRFKDTKDKSKESGKRWEVKLPPQSLPKNTVKQQQTQIVSTLYNKMAENESAIDREIRPANEREELLRREKEERLKLEEQQNGRLDISTFENVAKSPPVNKPLYHEMTEADRGSEMWQRETLIQQELREQEERELALKRKSLTPVRNRQDSETTEEVPYESIIQREIRLQKEKEEELEKQRTKKETKQDVLVDTISSQPPTLKQTVITNDNNSVQNDINHNEQKVNVSYEDAISGFQHEGESLIAREMRELREREEEVRRQRELALNTSRDSISNISTPPKSASSNSIPHSSSSSSIHPKQGTWQKDVSPYIQPIDHKRSASVDSLASSQSTGRTPSDYTPSRDIKVMPNVQDDSDDEGTPKHTPSSETPIQREIRLARDRENELRRSKGLPEIAEPEPTTPKQKSQNDFTGTPTSSYTSPRYHQGSNGQGQAVRSYASSRLQQELSSQKERELLYRKEGRIITTSEEHIEPLKYKEVAGMDQVDGPVKRNFNTKKVSNMNSPQSPEDINVVVEESTTPTRQTSSPVKAVKGGSGAQFSYKESRQTAESKIERELREMREREQELRKKNNPDLNEEDEPASPREKTLSQKIAGADGQTRSLADQWAQICQS